MQNDYKIYYLDKDPKKNMNFFLVLNEVAFEAIISQEVQEKLFPPNAAAKIIDIDINPKADE